MSYYYYYCLYEYMSPQLIRSFGILFLSPSKLEAMQTAAEEAAAAAAAVSAAAEAAAKEGNTALRDQLEAMRLAKIAAEEAAAKEGKEAPPPPPVPVVIKPVSKRSSIPPLPPHLMQKIAPPPPSPQAGPSAVLLQASLDAAEARREDMQTEIDKLALQIELAEGRGSDLEGQLKNLYAAYTVLEGDAAEDHEKLLAVRRQQEETNFAMAQALHERGSIEEQPSAAARALLDGGEGAARSERSRYDERCTVNDEQGTRNEE